MLEQNFTFLRSSKFVYICSYGQNPWLHFSTSFYLQVLVFTHFSISLTLQQVCNAFYLLPYFLTKTFSFKQIFDIPMGSCFFLIIATIYMKNIDHTATTTFHSPPSFSLRYIDDMFYINDIIPTTIL